MKSNLTKLADRLETKYGAAAKKPVYYGVFLDNDSREKLFNWWPAETGKELLSQKFGHHMTVKFKPSPEDIAQFEKLIGQNVLLKVVGYGEDEKGQAVAVVSKDISSSNAIPHITVACSDGTTPVYSNALLANSIMPVDGPVLSGTFDQFPRTPLSENPISV